MSHKCGTAAAPASIEFIEFSSSFDWLPFPA
jgi:hypothetical protein